MCIHQYEGGWTSNTGNGYYGGLQMDLRFMHAVRARLPRRWGTADNWPVWAQVEVAARRARIRTRFHALAEHGARLRPAADFRSD